MSEGISDPVSLSNAIDDKIKFVHTQSLDMSLNEILDMRQSEELNITPDYQRLFLWSEGARSRFIESLLLEMPVPPIYVVEEEDGKYLLIDGLQRVSSYLHFRGELEATHLDPPVMPGDKLELTDCDIVPELNGCTWDDLGTALQIRLKRAFVRVEVVRKGSDPRFKYHMFKRLNTGGTLLTDQQLRNCTIRLLDDRFNDFIGRLASYPSFKRIVVSNLTEDKRNGYYDQELVLRFLALKNAKDEFVHDIRDFLTDFMESVSDPSSPREFDYDTQEREFRKTFELLEKMFQERAFGGLTQKGDQLKKNFLIYHYEAFTVGLQEKINRIDVEDDDLVENLKDRLFSVKANQEFISKTTGGGKNSPNLLENRIDFVRKAVDEVV